MHKHYVCEYKCEECGLEIKRNVLKKHFLKHKGAGEKALSEENKIIACEDCEYFAQNFNDFGKHTYEKHRTGGRNAKEIDVNTITIGVQTDLIKCKKCEHSKNLKDSQRNMHMEHIETEAEKNKVVDRKEVIVQTEPVSIKSKDCESSMDAHLELL